jgi:hypothetical protein|nr:MAG TPA: Regulatory protein-modification, helix-turn-helix, transcriptional regulator, DNA [Caudoviricetes sp.]
MKEKLLKSLETMTKAELCKEIGISFNTLNKFLSEDYSTIRSNSIDKVKDYYADYYKEAKEEELKQRLENKIDTSNKTVDNSVSYISVKIDIPKLNKDEASFVDTLNKGDMVEKIGSLGYINYVLKSKSRSFIYWRSVLMKDRSYSDIDDMVDRLSRAVLCSAYTLDEEKELCQIKLPSEHYLCKYNNGDIGWSVEPNKFTVVSTREDLEEKYPEYSSFIVEKQKEEKVKRGFTINERTR